jgi:hypothetical protein
VPPPRMYDDADPLLADSVPAYRQVALRRQVKEL